MKLPNSKRIISILCTLAVVAFALQVFSDNKADVDIWGNVGFVSSLPWSPDYNYTNTYSFTEPDYPWVNHEWLGEYILNRTFVFFGNPGLLTLKVILGFSLLGLIYNAVRKQTKSGAIRFFYMVLTISTIGYGYSMRPHHFTYLMLALFLTMLTSTTPIGLRVLLVTPLLAFLWANLHGAFFAGMILLSCVALLATIETLRSTPDKRSFKSTLILFSCTAAFFASSLLNPYGLQLWNFVFESAAQARTYLSEWAPFHPGRDFLDHVDFIALALITIVSTLASLKKCRISDLGLTALAFTAAIMLRRNIPLFAIVAAFTTVRYVDATMGRSIDELTAKFSSTLLIILLAAFLPLSALYTVHFNKDRPTQIEIPSDKFPIESIAFLKHNEVKGNAIVFFNWAEECIWHLYPNVKVFLDGRFRSAYSEQTTVDFLNFFYDGTAWDAALKEYPTDIVFIHRTDALCKKMSQRPGWTLVHNTSIAAIFMKDSVHAPSYASFKTPERLSDTPLFP